MWIRDNRRVAGQSRLEGAWEDHMKKLLRARPQIRFSRAKSWRFPTEATNGSGSLFLWWEKKLKINKKRIYILFFF